MLANTQVNVPGAYNANITALDPSATRGVYFDPFCLPIVNQFVDDHGFPYRWYDSTVPAGIFGAPGFGFSTIVANQAGKLWPPLAKKVGLGKQYTFTTDNAGDLV